MYETKLGVEIQIIVTSTDVDPSGLNPEIGYIQITSVEAYHSPEDLATKKLTPYWKVNNISLNSTFPLHNN